MVLGIPVRGMVVVGVVGLAGLMYVSNGGGRSELEEIAAHKCEVTVVADILNVRAGPAETQPIVATMRRDAVAKAERRVENGFRLLLDGRWVKDEFVLPTSDSDCT
ncbi:SH3 domain-containing protein [Saccharothrix isguenensis]